MPQYIADTGYANSEIFLQSQHGSPIQSAFYTNNDLLFFLNESVFNIHSGYEAVIGLTSCIIPYSCYNICGYLGNNTIQFTKSFVTYAITVPDGNYNVKTLLAYLNASLNLGNINMTYNALTGLITVATTDGSPFSFQINNSSLAPMLGLTSTLVQNVSGTYTLFGNNMVDMRYTSAFYIQIPELITDNYISSFNGAFRTGIIAKVPVNISVGQTYNNVIQWVNQTGYETKIALKLLTSLHIRILDDKGRLVQFLSPWSISIKVGVITAKPIINYEKRLVKENNHEVELDIPID